MTAPDKIYLHGYPLYDEPCVEWAEVPFHGQFRGQQAETVEYIRKDIVDETIKTAEDHAYFAGQEKFREKLMEWVEEQLATLDKQTLLHPDDDVFWGQRNAYKQMKDKLNSL